MLRKQAISILWFIISIINACHCESLCSPPSNESLSSHFPSPISPCNSDPYIALTDPRYYSATQQCRTLCSTFSHPSFKHKVLPSNCTSCPQPIKPASFSTGCRYSDNFQVCIPRSHCMRSCGPELPGCVYTGACSHQICMFSSLTDAPATVTRATFSGPGTVFTAEDLDGSKVSTSLSRSGVAPRNFLIPDQFCGGESPYRLGSLSCQKNNQMLFNDGYAGGQCRSTCMEYDDEVTEIVRLFTECEFCRTNNASQFFEKAGQTICIPRNICIEHCGKEYPGCVYDGTCQSQVCFSALDSKQPASLSIVGQQEWDIKVTVNNTVPEGTQRIAVDPPVFSAIENTSTVEGEEVGEGEGEESLQIDSISPPVEEEEKGIADEEEEKDIANEEEEKDIANEEEEKDIADEEEEKNPATSSDPHGPEQTSSSEDALQDGSAKTDDGENGPGKWAWLGPVLGLFGAVLASAAGVLAAFVVRNGNSSSQNVIDSIQSMNEVAVDSERTINIETDLS